MPILHLWYIVQLIPTALIYDIKSTADLCGVGNFKIEAIFLRVICTRMDFSWGVYYYYFSIKVYASAKDTLLACSANIGVHPNKTKQ